MTAYVTAVYEGGLLRPTTPLPLQEGAQVEVIIISLPQGVDAKETADILAAISALPTMGGDPLTSSDHDQVLYGNQGT